MTLVQGTLISVSCRGDTLLLSLLIPLRLSGDVSQGKEEPDGSIFHFLFSIGVFRVYLESGMDLCDQLVMHTMLLQQAT